MPNKTLARLTGLGKHRANSGMTLLELLIVIAILGMIATAVFPFSSRIEDSAKKQKTVQILDSLRFALVGPDNAFDTNGNRVIGGYVGDFGVMPDLIVHTWDEDEEEWATSDKDNNDKPDVYDSTKTAEKYNQNAMPLALWTNYVELDGTAITLADEDTWRGPYITPPRDDFTGDDDLFRYTAPTTDENLEENREFWLRQGKGRLIDAWGSALLFYMEGKDLYVVSAGSDRRINYGSLDGSPAPYNSPADTSLAGNEDNLVMVVPKRGVKEESDLRNVMTLAILQDIKKGIIGDSTQRIDDVQQPNGFVADIGDVEPLVGSYVKEDSQLYRCMIRHTDTSFNSSSWKEITLDDASTTNITETIDDYPFATTYTNGFKYYGMQPSLLWSNADYVYVEDNGNKTYYRCNEEASVTGTFDESKWVVDNTFAGHDWVLKYDSTKSYTNKILPEWQEYDSVGFGAGWKGPYISDTAKPLTDAWGRQIHFEFTRNKGNLVLRSDGPDTSISTDDIIETIAYTDYAVPVTVRVLPEEEEGTTGTYRVETDDADYVTIYTAHSGGLRAFSALIDNSTDFGDNHEGVFYFIHTDEKIYLCNNLTVDASNSLNILSFSKHPSTQYDTKALHIPIGNAMVVYHSQLYSTIFYYGQTKNSYPGASPHPTAADIESNTTSKTKTTRYTYQKNVVIYSRTNPTIILGD